MRKLVSLLLLLAFAVSLCACGKTDSETASPAEKSGLGRYMESKVVLPLPDGASEQQFIGMYKADDAMVYFTTYGEGDETYWKSTYYRHTVKGESVTTEEVEWLNDACPEGGNQIMLTHSGGALYLSFGDYDENGKSQNHIFISRDDGKTVVELSGNGISSLSMITSLAAFDDGSIAVQDIDGAALLLDSEGNISKEIGKTAYNGGLAATARKLAYLDASGKSVRVYDLDTGDAVQWPIEIPEDSMTQMAFSSDGTLYLGCPVGLFSHAPDGTLWEKFVDGDSSNLGLPGYYLSSLALYDGEHAAVYVSDYMANIYSYTYDAQAYQTANVELNVFSLEENRMIRQAVVTFNRSRSDVKVNYTVASSLAGGGTAQDYIKTLNTELIAGTGPDVIILDGLPVDSYIEKGALADISAVVGSAEKMLPNVQKAYQTDGKMYAVPLGVELPLVMTKGEGAAFNSIGSLADAAEAANGRLLSSDGYSFETLPIMLLANYGDELYAGDAEAFLTSSERISNAIGSSDKLGEELQELFGMSEAETRDFIMKDAFYPQLRDYVLGNVDAAVFSINSLASVNCMAAAEAVEQYGGSLRGINSGFIPVGLVGINSASAQAQTAQEFVKTLLSYEVENVDIMSSDSFPVNLEALNALFSKENSNFSSGMRIDDEHELQGQWPSAAMRQSIRALIDNASKAVTAKPELDKMLLVELTNYLSGANTLEQALSKISSVLSTYLSE